MARNELCILFVIFFSVSLLSYGQEKDDGNRKIIDSLIIQLDQSEDDTGKVHILNDLSDQLLSSDPERSLKYAKYTYFLSEKIDYQKGISMALNNIGLYYENNGNYDKAMEFCMKSLEIIKKTGDKRQIANGYNSIGFLYTTMGKYDLAHDYIVKSIEILKSIIQNDLYDDDIIRSMAITYLNLGKVFHNKTDYDNALEYYLRSAEISENLGDDKGLCISYHNIGALNSKLGKNNTAIRYFSKSLEASKKTGNKEFYSTIATNVGVIYENMSSSETDREIAANMLKKALKYHLQSLKIKNDLKEMRGILISNNNIGSIYERLGDISLNKDTIGYYYYKALYYYDNTLKHSERTNSKLFISYACQGIGSIYYKTGEYSKALHYVTRSYNTASELGNPERKMRSAELLYKIYSVFDSCKESFKYYKIFTTVKDSMFNSESSEKIAEMQEKYESEKKEKEIKLLKVEKKMKDSELESKNRQLYIFISGFFVILVLFVILVTLHIQKIRSHKQLVIKNLEIVESEKHLNEAYIGRDTDYTSEKGTRDQISFTDKKYKDSTLTEEQKQKLEDLIRSSLEEDKLFLDSDISIDKLSSHLNTSRSYVSQVINEKFNRNFVSLINEYRIKEARRILSDRESMKFTIEAVSEQVGFNSVNTFVRAFKKYTGITPSFFVKSTPWYNQ